MSPKSDEIHESSKGTNHGYIVEWRTTEDLKIVARIDQDLPRQEWRQAPYDIKKMRLDGHAATLIRPVISHRDSGDSPHSLAGHRLMSLLVAEAVVACLKTLMEAHPDLEPLAKYTQFRVRPCKLVFDWKVTKDAMEAELDGSDSVHLETPDD